MLLSTNGRSLVVVQRSPGGKVWVRRGRVKEGEREKEKIWETCTRKSWCGFSFQVEMKEVEAQEEE